MATIELFKQLGKGWSYPFEYDNGTVKGAEYIESIKASLHFIFSTRLGEMFMQPELGSRIHELVGMNRTPVFYALAEEYVLEAVQKQEKRITNLAIDFLTSPDEPNLEVIFLSFEVIQTGAKDVFVFPVEVGG